MKPLFSRGDGSSEPRVSEIWAERASLMLLAARDGEGGRLDAVFS